MNQALAHMRYLCNEGLVLGLGLGRGLGSGQVQMRGTRTAVNQALVTYATCAVRRLAVALLLVWTR